VYREALSRLSSLAGAPTSSARSVRGENGLDSTPEMLSPCSFAERPAASRTRVPTPLVMMIFALHLRSASLTNTSTPSISGMTRSTAMCVGCHSSTARKNSTVFVMNRAASPTDSAMSCTILPT
jgi:hypothetical protein